MSAPAANAAGYAASSVLEAAAGVTGDLMLVHGCNDENVHWRHTARLVGALSAAGRSCELVLFPDERHMPRGVREREGMERRITAFLCRALSVPDAAAGIR